MGLRVDSARPQRVSGSARTDIRRAESARNPIASHVNFGDDSALSAFTRTQWTAAFTCINGDEAVPSVQVWYSTSEWLDNHNIVPVLQSMPVSDFSYKHLRAHTVVGNQTGDLRFAKIWQTAVFQRTWPIKRKACSSDTGDRRRARFPAL